MKILAIIPARKCSKGIPNKNIRIINGYPLIHYSILNALNSKYIDDIIVSTDSKEIAVYASQFPVKIKMRKSELAADDITLDDVVMDAIGDSKDLYDFVVTLQPTSPTLKVKTLDKAIEKCVKNKLDTVISAKNSPHLSWSFSDNKYVPNYIKRLNRQCLPPYYVETGAFVISSKKAIQSSKRIGNKIDIFELSENEAIDVDSFNDLYLCSNILKSQKIAIYVNGNNKRGLGHIYRALELADEFYIKPDIYYDLNQTDPRYFGSTTHSLIPVNGVNELYKICERKKYNLFINDILDTSIDYMIALRNVLPNCKIVNFEDCGEGSTKADLVFNALLGDNCASNMKCGYKYYICNKLFLFYKPIIIKKHVKKVFISFGGADPQNYTDRILRIIKKPKYNSLDFIIVLGKAKKNIESLMKTNNKNIKVLYDIENMPQIMSECDIGITSRGRTGYELAILGIPSISIAENAREEKHSYVCNENGFTYIGLNPNDEIIERNIDMYVSLSKESRLQFQKQLLKNDLKEGRQNVMALLND